MERPRTIPTGERPTRRVLGPLRLALVSVVVGIVAGLGAAVVLVPATGAVGVVWLVKTFAPEAKGHGVPEVMDAIYYHKGIIRPAVAGVRALASALSIGSGRSVGAKDRSSKSALRSARHSPSS